MRELLVHKGGEQPKPRQRNTTSTEDSTYCSTHSPFPTISLLQKVERETLRDEIRQLKPAYGTLLHMLEHLRQYAEQRDTVMTAILKKPPGRTDRNRLLAMLQETRMSDIDMSRFQTL